MPQPDSPLEVLARRLRGHRRLFLLGVTGGIASGKSTVVDMLSEMGGIPVDFDQLAREVVAPGQPVLAQVVALLGPGVLAADGRLDRKKTADIVFRDPALRRRLEALTHPAILAAFARRVDALADAPGDGVVLAAVPLLIEAGLQPLFDKLLVVWADRATQIARLCARDGIGRRRAERILAAQMPLDDKLPQADFVIRNQGPLADTRRQAAALWAELERCRRRKAASAFPDPP